MNNSILLKNYLDESVLIPLNNKLKIRLSKDLLDNYNKGLYNDYLNNLTSCIDLVDTLSIEYPGGAKPIFYLYILQDLQGLIFFSLF